MALRRVAGRVLDHSDVLGHLQQRHEDLVRTSTALADGIEMLRHDIAAATPERIVELAPVLQARSDAVAGHITTYEHDRERWARDLAVEEHEMIAAFERLLSLEDVERRFAGAPDPADAALATLPPPGSPAVQVREWWRGLSRAGRAGALVAAPGAVCNLGGIPSLVRDRANTVRLERDLAGLRSLRDLGQLTSAEDSLLRNAEAAAAARERATRVVDPRTGRPVPVLLYLYDPSAFDGDGAVALAVGDPDAAADVSVLVPGMDTDAADIAAVTDHAVAVYEAARVVDGSASHAALAWIGYDAPDNIPVVDGLGGDLVGAGAEAMAERGGEHLADLVDGLRAERDAPQSDLTVIGHSYGSTTAAHAAHDHGLQVDDLVVVGSPGLGDDVEHATDLGLDADHVWVGADSRDLVADLAGNGSFDLGSLLGLGLGGDPAGDDFGAIRFQAESTSRGLLDSGAGHRHYFDHDTESLHNIAEIVTGHGDQVTRAEPVTDPWWSFATDPERARTPTAPSTHLR